MVFPGQELLNQQLSDPSFSGEERRIQITGIYQFSATDAKMESRWVSAEVPLFENIGFGLDYFDDTFDFHSFSTVLFTTNVKIGLGDVDHFIKIGLSGGGESQKQDRIPLSQLPIDPDAVPNINDTNLEFAYRAGLHYNYRNLSLGGYFNTLPTQRIIRTIDGDTTEDELIYETQQGYAAYVMYNIRLNSNFSITPIARYLSYVDAPIYEGAMRLNYKGKVEASVSYKNDYSVNPAIGILFFDALRVSYSYEQGLGVLNFDDIHAVGLSYNFSKAKEQDEPEWMRQAKENIAKTDRIKEKKPKREKEKEVAPKVTPEPVVEKAPAPKEETPQPKEEEQQPLPETESEVKIEEPQPAPKEETKEVVVAEEAEQDPNVDPATLQLRPGYYIVAASFDNLQEAEAYVKRLKDLDYYSAIGKIDANSKYYVFIDSDVNEDEAIKRRRAQRLDPNFKNAWMVHVPE